MKLCEKCKTEKPFTAFQEDPGGSDGFAKYCDQCQGIAMAGMPKEKVFTEREVDKMVEEARANAARSNKCSECDKISFPDLKDVAREYGMTQKSVSRVGFPEAVRKWVEAGYKCSICGEPNSLSITKEGKIICSICLRSKNTKNVKAKK